MAAQSHILPVSFTTQSPYPLPSQKFMIPASWKRYQLSQLVNKVLSLTQPIPFDFIIRKTGKLLRGSLQEWCEASGVGMEETLEIEYVESLLPPSHLIGILHDDWVSDVSLGIPGHFVTASYDGILRVFDSSQELVHSIRGHTAPLTSVTVLRSGRTKLHEMTEVIFASSSHDNTARLTSYNTETKAEQALASLHLHTSTVSSITASSTGEHLLTAGWDNLIGVWDTKVPVSDEVALPSGDEVRTRKRRRVEEGATVRRKAPLTVLKSHTSRVMTAQFSPTDEKRAYSASLDSTIRSWDVEAGVCVHTQTVPQAFFIALAHLFAPDLIAVSSTDRTVRIFDTRTFSSRGSSLSTKTPIILQHTGIPSALAPSPTNAHHIASGCYDGVVRIWDVRSTKGAIASFLAGEGVDPEKRGEGKILALNWGDGIMAVGGEAGLDVWRVPERVEETAIQV